MCSCLHQGSCPAAFPWPGGPVRGWSLRWGPLQPEDSVPSLEWWPVPWEKAAAAHPARPCGPPRPLRPLLCSLSSSPLPVVTTGACPCSPPLPPTWGPACVLACPLSCLLSSPSTASPRAHGKARLPFSLRVRARWDVSRPALLQRCHRDATSGPDAGALRTRFGACEFSQNALGFAQNTELGAENLSARARSKPGFLGTPHQELVRFSGGELGSSQRPGWLWPGEVVMGQRLQAQAGLSTLLSTPWPTQSAPTQGS